MECRLVALC